MYLRFCGRRHVFTYWDIFLICGCDRLSHGFIFVRRNSSSFLVLNAFTMYPTVLAEALFLAAQVDDPQCECNSVIMLHSLANYFYLLRSRGSESSRPYI